MKRHKRHPTLINSSAFLQEATTFFRAIQTAKAGLKCRSEHYRILDDLGVHVVDAIRQISGEEVPWMKSHSIRLHYPPEGSIDDC